MNFLTRIKAGLLQILTRTNWKLLKIQDNCSSKIRTLDDP